MKILTNRTLYACSFCGKKYQSSSACLYHEEHKCHANPNNQHICFETCKHLERIESSTTEYGYTGAETEMKFKTFRCKKHDQEMYSFRLSKRHFLKPFIGGIRMPLDCSDYEVKFSEDNPWD